MVYKFKASSCFQKSIDRRASMRKLKHVGKAPVRFNFAVSLRHVRDLPEGLSMVSVCWERSGRAVETPAVPVEASSRGRLANLSDCELELQATLFRSSKRFEPKLTTIRLLDCSPARHGGSSVVAEAEIDLASAAASDAPQPDVRILGLKPLGYGAGGMDEMVLQLTITATPEAGADEENAHQSVSHGASYMTASHMTAPRALSDGEADSIALTRELALEEDEGLSDRRVPTRLQNALPNTLRESLPSTRESVPSTQSTRSTLSATQPTTLPTRRKVTPQQLLEAQEETRAARAHVHALQRRLRTEVLSRGTEAVLERAATIGSQLELGRFYHKELVFVMEQIEQIAYEHYDTDGTKGVATVRNDLSLEAELVQLRRALAATKVEVAQITGERDELVHEVKRLNQALTMSVSEPTDIQGYDRENDGGTGGPTAFIDEI